MIRPLVKSLALVFATTCCAPLFAQTAEAPKVDFPAPSPGCTLKQHVGLTDIEVNYSRPGAKGRKIFGGLEPYGRVWRTGANSATTISFSTPVKLNGTEIPAGKYELFSIPGEQEWTVIIHKNMSEWGAYKYEQKDDVARVTAKPISLNRPVETFTIEINDIRDDSATLNLSWENTLVPVTLQMDVVSKLSPQIEALMASDAPKKPYLQAAMFYYDHNLELTKAAQWMEKLVAEQPDAYWASYRQALVLEKLGDKPAAIAAAGHSIEVATKVGGEPKDEYIRLNEALLARLR